MDYNVITQHKIALDLWQLSKLQLEEIKANEGRVGARLYQMSCATMQAFAAEAVLNLIGNRVFKESWPERARWKEKAKLLCFQLKIDQSLGVEPFSSINELMRYRNTLAHGKVSPSQKIALPLDDQFPEFLNTDPSWLSEISTSRLENYEKQLKHLMVLLFDKSDYSWDDFYVVEEGWTG